MSEKPPAYFELGRMARDLLRRGYHPGIWQLETRTLTSSGFEFLTAGHATHNNQKVNGLVQSRYKMEDHGLTITEGWNTDKWLFGEVMHRDKLVEGMMLALGARFQPSMNQLNLKVKAGYAQEKFNFLADMDVDDYPVLSASVVLAHEEFLGGAGVDFAVRHSRLENWKVALGYVKEPAAILAEIKRGGAWLASLFYKVNDQIDAAAEIGKTARIRRVADEENPDAPQEIETGGDMTITVGMIYHLDENSLVRAKINDSIELGVGYEQKLDEGITASVSALIDLNHISNGNHRFGVGLAFQCQ